MKYITFFFVWIFCISAIYAAPQFVPIESTDFYAKASPDMKGLLTVDDAIARYAAIQNLKVPWTASGLKIKDYPMIQRLTPEEEDTILKTITNPSEDSTLKMPPSGLDHRNCVILKNDDPKYHGLGWIVVRFRLSTDSDGVDRKERVVPAEKFDEMTDQEIKEAFSLK